MQDLSTFLKSQVMFLKNNETPKKTSKIVLLKNTGLGYLKKNTDFSTLVNLKLHR